MTNKSAEKWMAPSVGVAPQSVGAATTTGNEVDLAMFEEVAFLLVVGALAATGTVTMKIQGSNTSGSGFADIAGVAFAAVLADTDDNKIKCMRVRSSGIAFRYVKPIVTTAGTANLIAVVAIPYSPRSTDATFGVNFPWETFGNPSAS